MRICCLSESKFFNMIMEVLKDSPALEFVPDLPADLVLLDYDERMDRLSLQTITRIKKQKVVLFMVNPNETNMFELLDFGVASILMKENVKVGELGCILEEINKDSFYLPPVMMTQFVERITKLKNMEHDRFAKKTAETADFTIKQSEIASLLIRGLRNKEIANILGLKESTVRVHVSNIYTKLRAKERKEAIKMLQEMYLNGVVV